MRTVIDSKAVLRAGHEKPDLGRGSLHIVLSSAHNAQLPLLLFPSLFNGQESSNYKTCWQHFHFKWLKILIFFSISSQQFKKFYTAFYYAPFWTFPTTWILTPPHLPQSLGRPDFLELRRQGWGVGVGEWGVPQVESSLSSRNGQNPSAFWDPITWKR